MLYSQRHNNARLTTNELISIEVIFWGHPVVLIKLMLDICIVSESKVQNYHIHYKYCKHSVLILCSRATKLTKKTKLLWSSSVISDLVFPWLPWYSLVLSTFFFSKYHTCMHTCKKKRLSVVVTCKSRGRPYYKLLSFWNFNETLK